MEAPQGAKDDEPEGGCAAVRRSGRNLGAQRHHDGVGFRPHPAQHLLRFPAAALAPARQGPSEGPGRPPRPSRRRTPALPGKLHRVSRAGARRRPQAGAGDGRQRAPRPPGGRPLGPFRRRDRLRRDGEPGGPAKAGADAGHDGRRPLRLRGRRPGRQGDLSPCPPRGRGGAATAFAHGHRGEAERRTGVRTRSPDGCQYPAGSQAGSLADEPADPAAAVLAGGRRERQLARGRPRRAGLLAGLDGRIHLR